MTGKEKIDNVEAQMVLMERGQVNAFTCPYCGQLTPHGQQFCCRTLMKAVMAVIERRDLKHRIEQVDQIAENISRILQ